MGRVAEKARRIGRQRYKRCRRRGRARQEGMAWSRYLLYGLAAVALLLIIGFLACACAPAVHLGMPAETILSRAEDLHAPSLSIDFATRRASRKVVGKKKVLETIRKKTGFGNHAHFYNK